MAHARLPAPGHGASSTDYDRATSHYADDLGFTLMKDTHLGGGRRWAVVSPGGAGGDLLLLARAADAEQAASIGRQTGGRQTGGRQTGGRQTGGRQTGGRVVVFGDAYGSLWELIEPAATR